MESTNRSLTLWILAMGLLLGLAGNLFFFDRIMGLSFPLFVLLAGLCGLWISRVGRIQLPVRNLWPALPLAFFAIMVAVRDSASLTGANLLAVLALASLIIYYLPGTQFIDRVPFLRHMYGLLETGMGVFFAPILVLVSGGRALQKDRHTESTGQAYSGAVLRGVLLALPVILVFAVLLSSADAIFAGYLDRIWDVFRIEDIDVLIGRTIFIATLAWLAWGALGYGLARDQFGMASRASEQVSDDWKSDPFAPDAETAERPLLRLGMIETGIVLGSVDLLFAAFVFIQIAYFFGGDQNVSVSGLTYSEYARRGFFELVAVSVLTLGLSLALDQITERKNLRSETLFRALAILVVALTGVMLVSAWQRMSLYEQIFGFTHLRLYTHIFMLWMGVLFVVYLLALFRVRQHIFSLGLLLVITGYLLTLNAANPDLLITERNLARYHEGYALDAQYLNQMSADAVPALAAFYQEDEASIDATARQCVGILLRRELARLDRIYAESGGAFFSANAARGNAWQILNALDENLPDNNASFFVENCHDAMLRED